jgi:hypothetical protein
MTARGGRTGAESTAGQDTAALSAPDRLRPTGAPRSRNISPVCQSNLDAAAGDEGATGEGDTLAADVEATVDREGETAADGEAARSIVAADTEDV